jgi:hypothetical protein
VQAIKSQPKGLSDSILCRLQTALTKKLGNKNGMSCV